MEPNERSGTAIRPNQYDNVNNDGTADPSSPSERGKLHEKLRKLHARTPLLQRLPFRAVAAIALLILVQLAGWAVAVVVLHRHGQLIGTAAIAWTLGLRHALDADHISCIDLTTRRLVAAGQRPVTVGTFFSLGHSAIVVVTSVVVAATSSAAAKHFDFFSRVGGIAGSAVSAAFLLLLGAMNAFILRRLVRQLRLLMRTPPGCEPALEMLDEGSGGCLYGLAKRLFRLIDAPWKMFPVGVLFGLGFDTSSEVALLGISALQASKGTSLWFILCFPLLFTAGMCLVDTIDGAVMMSLYSSASTSRDPFVVTYYSLVLTAVTVAVALFIGTLQALELADAVLKNPSGPFWDGVEKLGNRYEIIGSSSP